DGFKATRRPPERSGAAAKRGSSGSAGGAETRENRAGGVATARRSRDDANALADHRGPGRHGVEAGSASLLRRPLRPARTASSPPRKYSPGQRVARKVTQALASRRRRPGASLSSPGNASP